MTHLFDVDIAGEYSVDVAIIVQHLAFWINKNMADNRNFNDGSYWTFTSTRALTELFPYWTENQIRRIIKTMIGKAIIKTGNYNQQKYDRTTWYAFTNAFLQKHKSIFTNAQMEVDERPNGSEQKHEPIPDKSTDVSTDKSTDNVYEEVVGYYNSICSSLPKATKLSDTRKRAIKSLLKEFSVDEVKSAFDKVEGSPFLVGKTTSWKANFDWLINKKNILKVIEGAYDNTPQSSKENEYKGAIF